MTDEKQTIVIAQAWEESERGWGVRPDGVTLHLSKDDYDRWMKEYDASHTGPVPDEYTRTSGNPFSVSIGSELREQLEKSKRDGHHGVWFTRLPAGAQRVG